MEVRRPQPEGDLYLQDGFWKLRWHEERPDANGSVERKPTWIGPAAGPEGLSKEQAQRIVWEHFLPRQEQIAPVPQSAMTIADFVEKAFVPEHVAIKGLSGRTHYRAILKHVLTPEEVDRAFQAGTKEPRSRLKAVPDWPYLGNVRLCDARPDDVQRLVSAALDRGYSTQTAKHICNVVSAIFTHARKKQWFTFDNPASLVTLPKMTRKEAHTLTLAQAQEVLTVMQYPEKEMALFAILTSLNVAEICGLQWKHVNMTVAWSHAHGEAIPPRTIAVRKQWRRGTLGSVEQKSRRKSLPISEPLLPILLGLSQRLKFTGPDDFVFVSQAGKPVNENNIARRRLKAIGRNLRMPWLSWRVFRRTQTTLTSELGIQVLWDRVAKDEWGSLSGILDGRRSGSAEPGTRLARRAMAQAAGKS